MIFDVMMKVGENANGKQIVRVYRVHDSKLSKMLRDSQLCGSFIVGVIPLFRSKIDSKKVRSFRDMTVDEVFPDKISDYEPNIEDETRL